MTLGVNKVMLIGNVGRDPELRSTQAGLAVTNLRLAVSERRKDSGGEWREYTDWITVVCFGRNAENVGEHVRKGKLIFVEGRLQNRTFRDRDGNERWTTEVVADRVIFLGSRDAGGGRHERDERDDDGPDERDDDLEEDRPRDDE
jgi:single-strand DNA-binding protein